MRLVGDVAVALCGAEPSRALDASHAARACPPASVIRRLLYHLRAHGIDVIGMRCRTIMISAADLAFAENLLAR